jgi:hypothetical protein
VTAQVVVEAEDLRNESRAQIEGRRDAPVSRRLTRNAEQHLALEWVE